MKFVVDESVSRSMALRLRELGHEAIAISEGITSASSDEQVFAIAEEDAAILVTRDYHFTNPVRFPTAHVGAILYIRHGNLTSEEESQLVERFLEINPPETYNGRLVTLYRHSSRLR